MKRLFNIWNSLCLILILFITVGAEADPIKIGFVGDFSSVSKSYTNNMYMAARMAVDEFNAAGGLLGRSVELIKRDGANNPQKHYNLIKSLAKEEKVVAIFGGASSPPVLKASEACLESGIPYLVSIGNSESIVIEKGHPYVFQFQPTSAMETKGFSIFVTLMPWERYAWVGPDYSWGHDVLKKFKLYFKEIGDPIKWTSESWHPLETTDFKSIIDNILRGKPEALVVGSWGEDVKHFFTQAASRDLFEKLVIFGWFTYDLAGETGQMVPKGMWSMARGGPFNYLADKYPQSNKFVIKFNTLYSSYPNGFSICCYDSFLAWSLAVKKAKSAEPAAVAEALKGLKFTGLRGENTIRAVDGQMDSPIYFGRLVQQKKYPFPVWESVIEIPAAKIWLTEKEVHSRRKNPGS